jgi:hypothetical protein
MSNSSARGCRRKGHYNNRWAIYDSLPREIRDELKIARTSLCAAYVRNRLRHEGLEQMLAHLSFRRRLQKERRGREMAYCVKPEGPHRD